MAERTSDDDFSLWYRFKTTVIFNLLNVAGPASLDDEHNPRVQIEQEYLRRKAIHVAEKTGRPVEEIRPSPPSSGIDPVVVMMIGLVLGVGVLCRPSGDLA